MLRRVASDQDRWSGIPLPLEGERLIVEPTYPGALELMKIGMAARADVDEDAEFAGWKVRNSFWSSHKRSDIEIYEKPDGGIDWGVVPGVHSLKHAVKTLGCSEAWGIEQEATAVNLLGTLLRHHAFKHYLMTGMFLETSKRSGVTYLFRRLRPTVAIAPTKKGSMHILCTLCQHPIAYYADSWAGAMCPTDDVIAHLMLMRGDEPMFWRRSNQHPAYRPQSGL